jgi:hypothetical protein
MIRVAAPDAALARLCYRLAVLGTLLLSNPLAPGGRAAAAEQCFSDLIFAPKVEVCCSDNYVTAKGYCCEYASQVDTDGLPTTDICCTGFAVERTSSGGLIACVCANPHRRQADGTCCPSGQYWDGNACFVPCADPQRRKDDMQCCPEGSAAKGDSCSFRNVTYVCPLERMRPGAARCASTGYAAGARVESRSRRGGRQGHRTGARPRSRPDHRHARRVGRPFLALGCRSATPAVMEATRGLADDAAVSVNPSLMTRKTVLCSRRLGRHGCPRRPCSA